MRPERRFKPGMDGGLTAAVLVSPPLHLRTLDFLSKRWGPPQWRVASALKWAFADLETVSVNVDRETLSKKDLETLIELLRLRPIQFCIFLKALIRTEGMERLMKDGIEGAKREE